MELETIEYFFKNGAAEYLPCSIYWKDKDGVYLDCNNYLKKKMAVGPVKGGTDYDAFNKESANQIRSNDIDVMQQKHTLIKQENLVLPDDKTIVVMSSKKPIIDEGGEAIGVLGMSFDIALLQSNRARQASSGACLILQDKWKNIYLTRRQAECAYYLCQGKTVKEIAAKLEISPRTVEVFLKQLKIKFGCYKRSALIEVLLSDKILSEIVNFI